MLLGNSFNMLLYLKEKSLDVYSSSGDLLGKIDFPQTMIDNQEIIDEKKFQEYLSNFFSKLEIDKHNTLLLLSQSLIFEKIINAKDDQQIDQDIEKFFSEIPFDPQKVARAQINQDSTIILLAANRQLFELIETVFESFGGKIAAVIPFNLIEGVNQSDILSKQDIQLLTKNEFLRKTGNIFTTYGKLASESSKKKSEEKIAVQKVFFMEHGRTLLVYIAALIFLASALAFITVYFGLIKNPLSFLPLQQSSGMSSNSTLNTTNLTPSPTTVKESTSSTTAISSPSATPVPQIDKKDLTVQILNGSGVSGQAGNLRDQLEEIGFENIKVGNTESDDPSQTTITFSDKVPQYIKDELIKELEETFAEVTTQKSPSNTNFDIIIITGEYL